MASYNIHQDSDDLTNAGSSHDVDSEETESETEPVEDNKTDNLQPAGYSLPNPIQNHPPRHPYITRSACIYIRSGLNELGGLSCAGNAHLIQHRAIIYIQIPSTSPSPIQNRPPRHSYITRRAYIYIPEVDATSLDVINENANDLDPQCC